MQTTLDQKAYATSETLYMALELSGKQWKACFGDGKRSRQASVAAGDREAVLEQLRGAKRRLGLPAHCTVLSGYEAGRDGFWVHRWLGRQWGLRTW